MTNLEFYKDELIDMGIDNVAVDKETGELRSCCYTVHCDECLFNDRRAVNFTCAGDKLNWLLKEHEEEKND